MCAHVCVLLISRKRIHDVCVYIFSHEKNTKETERARMGQKYDGVGPDGTGQWTCHRKHLTLEIRVRQRKTIIR